MLLQVLLCAWNKKIEPISACYWSTNWKMAIIRSICCLLDELWREILTLMDLQKGSNTKRGEILHVYAVCTSSGEKKINRFWVAYWSSNNHLAIFHFGLRTSFSKEQNYFRLILQLQAIRSFLQMQSNVSFITLVFELCNNNFIGTCLYAIIFNTLSGTFDNLSLLQY